MAVDRSKLANPQPLVSLLHHPYQYAFMQARRQRICSAGHQWYYTDTDKGQGNCPTCKRIGWRAFNFFMMRAGRRGGKTRCGALALIEELAIPGVRWWACAPTFPKLRDYVLPAFFAQIPRAWVDHPLTHWSETDLTLTLPNKSQVQFRSLEDPDRGRGPGLNGVWIDEICELTLLHWETISPALADQNGILIATSSPKGEDWVHETFYEPAERCEPGYWACAFTTLDNPWMQQPGQRAFVERQRKLMTDLMFRQEYLAEVVTFTGAIYGDLVDRCTCDGTDEQLQFYFPEWPSLDPARPSVSAVDPGTDHPFAGVHLVASPHGLVAVGEYEQRNKPYQLHADAIKYMRGGFQGRCGIDRSQAQAQIELAQYGLITIPAENDVVAGINRVSAWMLRNRRHPGLGIPLHGLVLPKRLVPLLVKRLRPYRWADNQKADGSTKNRELVYKKNDDLCFVAGTLIATAQGARPIESIRAGEHVWTRSGLRRVCAAGETGVRPVKHVLTTDGRRLTGTGNHPIWVEGRAFSPIDGLRYGDILAVWPLNAVWSVSGKVSGSIVIPARRRVLIASIGSRIKWRVARGYRRCTKKFGSTRTGQSRSGTISTIATGIRSTTVSGIWKRSRNPGILATIIVAGLCRWQGGDIWDEFVRWLQRGTDLLPAYGGIENTGARRGHVAHPARLFATSAVGRFYRKNVAVCASVLTRASRRGGVRFNAIWKSGRARCVEWVSSYRNGSRPAPAHVGAVRVSAIFPGGTARVYNLTIDGAPEYIANGVLVHNCDALRYALMTYPTLPDAHPVGADGKTRDLAALPANVRRDIERERASRESGRDDGLERMDEDMVPVDGVGDFCQ